jgi:hypothetical protein
MGEQIMIMIRLALLLSLWKASEMGGRPPLAPSQGLLIQWRAYPMQGFRGYVTLTFISVKGLINGGKIESKFSGPYSLANFIYLCVLILLHL